MANRFMFFLKISVCIVIVLLIGNYIIVSQTWRKFQDDLNIFSHFAVYFVSTSLFGLRRTVLFSFLLLTKARRLPSQHGVVILSAYGIFIVLFSYCFVVYVLEGIVMVTWTIAKQELNTRVENNIIGLEEYRTNYEVKTNSSNIFYRYKEEDVAFTWEDYKTWGSQKNHPYVEVIWRRNGKPLPAIKRFHEELHIKEVPYNLSWWKSTERPDWTVFKVTATLIIYHVKSYDFGNYTCDFAQMALHEYQFTPDIVLLANRHFTSDPLKPRMERMKRNLAAKMKMEHRFVMWSYYHTWKLKLEFMLVEIPRKKTIVHAPPGAIMAFEPRYRHLSDSNDSIATEYFINGQSAETGECRGLFKGCSTVFLLYLYFNYNIKSFPPMVQNLDSKWSIYSEKVSRYYRCVCKKTYGSHNVYYLRRFYNSSSGQYDLVEIRHPEELLLLPRDQDMLNLFQNKTSHENQHEFESFSSQDMHLLKTAAEAVVNEFDLWENLFIVFSIILFLLIIWACFRFVKIVGKVAGRFILDHLLPCRRRGGFDRRDIKDSKSKFSSQYFDIFISHLDCDTHLVTDQILPVLQACGQRVCTSELDIPPNLQILSAVSTAVDNSTRCIIIWSSEYLNDEFKLNMEVDMIGNKAVCSKTCPRSPLLVIKLDDCPLLPWMMSFEVHDWTTALSRDDQLRRLSRWVQKGVK